MGPTERLNLLQKSYFVYNRSSLVRSIFITEINKFLLIYFVISSFSEKKQRKLKTISHANQISLTIETNIRKKGARLQIAKFIEKKYIY